MAMKATQQEKQWLKDYLYQVMKYKETYEEVYDHMLLAIENEPENRHFEAVVLHVLERDFGGNNGLLALEEACRETAEENATAQYRNSYKQWFLTRYALVTLTIFAGLFWTLHFKHFFPVVLLVFFIFFFAPIVLLALRWLGLGYKQGDTKASLKDDITRKVSFKSYFTIWKIIIFGNIYSLIVGYIFNIKMFVSNVTPPVIHSVPTPTFVLNLIFGVIACIFILIMVHVLAIIQLYRAEFTTQMTVN
jgi:hypothetical protein